MSVLKEEHGLQHFIIGNDEAELELAAESRSFVNRVNHQVRKRQTRFSNGTEWRNNFMIWGMFMAVSMESAVFMGKNYLNICQSIANTTDLTLKQVFDIFARMVSEQEEILDWKHVSLKIIHGNTCH